MTTQLASPRLREFLHQGSISDLLLRKSKTIVEVQSTDTLAVAVKTLSDSQILSVPVKEEGEYIGYLDVLDVVTFVLLTYSEGEDVKTMQWSDWCQNIDELTHRGVEFGNTQVKEVMNASKRDKWCPLENGTLYQLIEVFARGVHRVPIISAPGHILGLLSQSDIISMLHKEARQEGLIDEALGAMTLKDLGLDRSEGIITMSVNAQAIHAFWDIYFNKVSAVAVTDKEGKLLGNLSASDIRGIGGLSRRFSALLLPLGEFTQIEGPEFSKSAIKCGATSTFDEVITLLAENKIHRVWVVENEKPVGLVSTTDIMKVITRLEPTLP